MTSTARILNTAETSDEGLHGPITCSRQCSSGQETNQKLNCISSIVSCGRKWKCSMINAKPSSDRLETAVHACGTYSSIAVPHPLFLLEISQSPSIRIERFSRASRSPTGHHTPHRTIRRLSSCLLSRSRQRLRTCISLQQAS